MDDIYSRGEREAMKLMLEKKLKGKMKSNYRSHNLSIKDADWDLLVELAEKHNVTKTRMVEMMIRTFAETEER